ncbi:MAG: SpoIIE family protein phosphatase [Bacteroidia bacterium]|nr:SpoIIE family protein phosphatase [Bacteroidia bacterium]
MIFPIKKQSFFLACSFVLFLQLSAQQHAFDSIRRLIPSEKAPAKKALLLIAAAKSIYNSAPDSSIGYCEEAEQISRKHHLDVQLAYSLNCECRYLLLKGDLEATVEKLNAAIALFEKHGEQTGLAKSYSLKSIALGRLHKTKEELDYLLKAKAIYESSADKEGHVSVLLNLANTYCKIKNYDAAIAALEEIRHMKLPSGETDFYLELNYGNVYDMKQEYRDALLHYERARQAAVAYHMTDSEITGLTQLGATYLKLNDLKNAGEYYRAAIALAQNHHLLVEEKDALEGMVHLYEQEKNYLSAFEALKRYKLLDDSLFNIDKVNSIHQMEQKLRLSEKEKIIAEQGFSLEKEKTALAEEKNRAFLLLAGLALAASVCLFLIYYSRKIKRLLSLIRFQKKEVELQKEIIESKNKDVMDSIHYARHIQGSMLPSAKAMEHLFREHFILYKPKDVVAGDFYWTESIGGMPAILVGDCTGHGVPGAMVSIVACNALNRAVKEFGLSDPAKIFDKVNELMQETFSKSDYDVSDGMDAALCLFDERAMKLHIAAANNPVWLVSPPGITTALWEEPWKLSQVSADKRPIGKFRDEVLPFERKTVSVEKGEMIYLFSDGYADQFGGSKGKKFKYKHLQELLTSIARLPLNQQRETLETALKDWQGDHDQVDDILIVGIRV